MLDLQRKFEEIIRKWNRANIGTIRKEKNIEGYEISFTQHLKVCPWDTKKEKNYWGYEIHFA